MPKKSHFAHIKHNGHSFSRLNLLLPVMILLNGLSMNAFGQVAIPLTQLNSELPKEFKVVVKIKSGNDRLFVVTHEGGLWIVSKDGRQVDKAKINEDDIGGFRNLETVGEQLFVGTDEGLLWVLSKDGKQADKVESIRWVRSIKAIGNQLFVATDEGFWIVNNDGKQANKVKGITERLTFFYSIDIVDDRLFVSTLNGLWVVSNDGKANKVEPKEYVESLETVGEQLFVPTEDGLLIISKDGKTKKVEGVEGRILDIGKVGERRFVNTNKGLWIVGKDGKQATQVESVEGILRSITTAFGGEVFVGTDDGLWIVSEDGKQANKIKSIKGYVDNIETVGEYIYLWTLDEIYRLEPKVVIKTKLAPITWWATAIGYVSPQNWILAGKVQAKAFYSDENGKDPYDNTIPKEFRFAKADSDTLPSDDKFSTQEQFNYEIAWGKNEVHYWVKDKWGNTFEQKATYYGVPSEYFFAGILFILPASFVLGCFTLAPRVGFCHSAIMNPWLRRYFSLGSVPLLLSVFPSLRRHLLRRYSDSVNKDKEFSEWKKRFVCPDEEFQPENFGKKLESERRLLLTGQSGIGKTSFFKHLTVNYASQDKPTHPAKVFPVYIPLINYGGNSLEDLVYNQLFSYGKITDQELAPMFLEQGGLLIFLDGVDEIQNVTDRQKLSAFVERFWTSNYICLSSQQSYPEIENVPKVELKRFSREKVCEFIRQRVNDKENAENVIKKLTDEDYQLYSVPRDLEFAVQILNSGEKFLPRSRTELYRITFSFIFAKWKEKGTVDTENNLCKRAYTMLVQRDPTFDSVDDPRFTEVTPDLFEQKFLVRRGGSYNFRHDLIRSYLASEYFYSRWKNLFEEITGKAIDSNWLEMLKFSCENIEDHIEVRSLVYEVLNRSVRKDVVKDLFEWLKANHPSKCRTWEKDFYAKYGELDFK